MVAAQGASSLGDAAATVTLALRLYDKSHSSWVVAGLLVAILGPSVVGAPLAASLVGRFGPRRVLITANSLQAIAASALAAVSGPGSTLVLTVAVGAGFAVTQPAALALLPRLVDDDGIVRANSLVRTADWTAWTVGPLVGGGLLETANGGLPLILDAVSFLAAAIIIAGIHSAGGAEPATGNGDAGSAGRRFDRLRRVMRDRPVRALLLIVGSISLFVPMASIGEVFLAREVLRTSAFGFTTLGTAFTAGTVAGTILAPRVCRRETAAVMGSLMLMLTGFSIAIVGMAETLQLALVPYTLAGLAFGVQTTATRSIIQPYVATQVRPDDRAYVFSVYVAVGMGSQLAAFLCGATVIQLVGARPVMWLAGGGAALAGLLGYLRRSVWAPPTGQDLAGAAADPDPRVSA
jgi:MFS family permease